MPKGLSGAAFNIGDFQVFIQLTGYFTYVLTK